jgi:arabinofuranosyltransferase
MREIGQRWGAWPAVLVALFVALYGLQTQWAQNGYITPPLDDAWIHYQFARNLSDGQGFSFNPGEPTPGSTAPLWTLLLAGVGLFTDNFVAPSLLLSGFFFLLTVWLTYQLTLAVADKPGAALLAALAVALTGRMLWAGLSAMEATLFTTLTLAAVWRYQRHGLELWSGLLFVLASQARPEGHALFALAAADTVLALIWRPAARPEASWRGLFTAGAVYGLVTLPYVLFSYSVTERPLPNTFYAKSQAGALFSWRTLRETLTLHWRDNEIAFLFILPGLWPIFRRNRPLVGWLVGLTLLTPFIVPFLWHHGRYTLPLIPFQMIAAAAGLYWLKDFFGSRQGFGPRQGDKAQRKEKVGGFAPWGEVVFIAMAALFLLAGGRHIPAWANMLASNGREVVEIDLAMGEWLARETAADALIAVDDIGAIAFVGQRRVFDLNGLVSPEMWPAMTAPDRDAATIYLMAQAGVTHLALFPGWHSRLVSVPDMTLPVAHFETATHTIIGEPEAVIYAVNWPYQPDFAPRERTTAVFGEQIRLLGYDLQPPAAGEPLRLTLYWESLAADMPPYHLFIHLMDEQGEIAAQVDRQPFYELAPTYLWQPGDRIRDPHEIMVPPGRYQLSVGVYSQETMMRLTAVGPQVAHDALILVDSLLVP